MHQQHVHQIASQEWLQAHLLRKPERQPHPTVCERAVWNQLPSEAYDLLLAEAERVTPHPSLENL